MGGLRVNIEVPSWRFTPRSRVLSLGSCFSEEMTRRLAQLGLATCSNSFGTLYNPVSIAALLEKLASGSPYGEADLLCAQGRWFTAHHSTGFGAGSPEKALAQANASWQQAREFSLDANTLILTLGTAVVHSFEGKVVANCHKLPHRLFEKRMLCVEECTQALTRSIAAMRALAPGARVLVTLSPLRHTPQDLSENSLSKCTLRVAIAEARRHCELSYFPAYEIAADELARPRHFERDGIHLNSSGVAYIYRRFRDAFFDRELVLHRARLRELRSALGHRPQDLASPATLTHFVRAAEKLLALCEESPDPDFTDLRLLAAKRLVALFGKWSKSSAGEEIEGLIHALVR